MVTIPDSIIIGCWIIYLAYFFLAWRFISAQRVKATVKRQSWSSTLAYRIPVALGCLLLLNPGLPPSLNLVLTPHADWARVIGVMICGFGLFVTIWARRTLAGNWSSDVTFKQGHELVKAGPYHFVRHPIYSGILLMCIGSAVAVARLCGWLGVVLVGVGFWIKLKQEESLMLQHFPNEYPVYRKQVKALVPFVI